MLALSPPRPVETKGAGEEWLVDQLLEDIETGGLFKERIIVKSSQEHYRTKVKRSTCNKREAYITEIEKNKVGDSNTNGNV